MFLHNEYSWLSNNPTVTVKIRKKKMEPFLKIKSPFETEDGKKRSHTVFLILQCLHSYEFTAVDPHHHVCISTQSQKEMTLKEVYVPARAKGAGRGEREGAQAKAWRKWNGIRRTFGTSNWRELNRKKWEEKPKEETLTEAFNSTESSWWGHGYKGALQRTRSV